MDGLDPAWAWISAGLVLAVAEIALPGYFLIWVGAAALLTGALTLASGVGTAPQLVIFTVATIASLLAARRWMRETGPPDDMPLLNEPVARLIDSIVIVVEPVDADRGRVRVADGTWPARGGPAATGELVRVVAVEGGHLIVTPRGKA